MAIKLINKETGEEVHVSQESLPAYLATGEYFPSAGETVAVVNRQGEQGSVAAEDIDDAMASGWAPQSTQSLRTQQLDRSLEAEYGDGFWNTALAATEGVARGLSFGLSDVALEGLGADVSERREYNPIAAGVGELAGAVAPAFFTGGASAGVSAARAAGGAARAAKAGSLAARVLRATPAGLAARAGAGIAARGAGAVTRAAAMAAGGAVEGGLHGVGTAISRLALEDEELSGERIMSVLADQGVKGALLGGAIGGATSVVTDVAKVGARAVGKLLPRRARTAEQIAEVRQGFKSGIQRFDEAGSDIISQAKNSAVSEAVWPQLKQATAARDRFYKAFGESQEALFSGKTVTDKALDKIVKQGSKVEAKELVSAAGEYTRSIRQLAQGLDAVAPDAAAVARYGKQLQAIAAEHGGSKLEKLAAGAELADLMSGDAFDVEDIPVVGTIAGLYTKLALVKQGGSRLGISGGERWGKLLAWTSRKTDDADRAIASMFSREKFSTAAIPAATRILNSFAGGKKRDTQAAFADVAKEIERLPSDPAAVEARLAQVLDFVPDGVRRQVVAAEKRRIDFLKSKLPPSRNRSIVDQTPRVSGPAAAKFARYLRAANDPSSVLKDVAQGRLSAESIEVMQTVYPRMLIDIQEQIGKRLDKYRKMPRQVRLQLSRLTGLSLEGSVDPDFIRIMQSLSPGAKGETKPSGKLAAPQLTTTDRLITGPGGQR